MVGILQDNVEQLTGARPKPIVSLGGTDARLWRQAGVPAYVYGPRPTGMGGADEHVEIAEYLHVLRTHLLSALRLPHAVRQRPQTAAGRPLPADPPVPSPGGALVYFWSVPRIAPAANSVVWTLT